ncbi:MAG TPA: hypothetical protein VFD15_04180 [Clostridia bacterium]|nr:hypothetical protein [Clostridia bacterium]
MYYGRSSASNTVDPLQVIKEEIKNEVLNELLAMQDDVQTGNVQGGQEFHHYIRDTEGPFPKLIDVTTGEQGKGILYGVGTVALLGMLQPGFRRKAQTVFGRTFSEGVELLEKARAMVARAKEDIEDLVAEANFNGLVKKTKR